MDNTIILKGNGGNLELEVVNDLNWTRCYLVTDKRLLLGADGLSYVVAGLSKALQESDSDTSQPDGIINSTSVRYAIHLEETHHSLYFGDDSETRLLFWQSDARPPITLVGIIHLSRQQRRHWLQTLNAELDNHREPVLAGR